MSTIHFISQNGMPFWLKDQDSDPQRLESPPTTPWCDVMAAAAAPPTTSSPCTRTSPGGRQQADYWRQGPLQRHPVLAMAHMARHGYTTMKDLGGIPQHWQDNMLPGTSTSSTMTMAGQTNSGPSFPCGCSNVSDLQKKPLEKLPGTKDGQESTLHFPQGKSTGLDAVCDRKQILVDWDRRTAQPRPKLTLQGSAMGRLASSPPRTSSPPYRIQKTSPSRSKERQPMTDGKGRLKKRKEPSRPQGSKVFRNNLFVCLISFPQHPQFNVTKEDLDEWYEWFWGYAERNAWREIHNEVYEGATLKDALRRMVLTHLPHLGRTRCKLLRPWHFLEHPADPRFTSNAPSAWRCSSIIWATRATLFKTTSSPLINVGWDKSPRRLPRWQPTSTSNTGGICFVITYRRNPNRDTVASSDLSRYPWPMIGYERCVPSSEG